MKKIKKWIPLAITTLVGMEIVKLLGLDLFLVIGTLVKVFILEADWGELIVPLIFLATLTIGVFFSALFNTIKAKRIAERKRENARLEAIRKQQEEEYNHLVAYNQMLSTKK